MERAAAEWQQLRAFQRGQSAKGSGFALPAQGGAAAAADDAATWQQRQALAWQQQQQAERAAEAGRPKQGLIGRLAGGMARLATPRGGMATPRKPPPPVDAYAGPGGAPRPVKKAEEGGGNKGAGTRLMGFAVGALNVIDGLTGGAEAKANVAKAQAKAKSKRAEPIKIVRAPGRGGAASVARPTGARSVASGAATSGFVSKYSDPSAVPMGAAAACGGTSTCTNPNAKKGKPKEAQRNFCSRADGGTVHTKTDKAAGNLMKVRDKVGDKMFDRGLRIFAAL